ncbi:MAG: chloride channel protein [Synechocystis sp.]|nr:chloride channel protein [Synechocystis sp.]
MAWSSYWQRALSWLKTRHYGRTSIDSRYAIFEACIIGFFSALAALGIKKGVNWLGSSRLSLADTYGAIWVLPLFGLVLGSLAGALIEQFSKPAGGGGIPQVKAALARFPIPLNWRVAVVKLLGTVLVLGSGIPLGRRAPTVHIGAALASELSRLLPTSPEHRRQMIAAGAAAGLAAGFTTPIAGVLFVVEELMRDVSSLTLETAIVASFVGAVTSLVLQSNDLNLTHPLGNNLSIGFSASEIPFYLLLGILAGILGVVLNRGILTLQQFQRQWNISLALRIGGIGLIAGTAIAFMPPFFRDNAGLREFVISGELGWQSIVLALVVHFCLTMLAYSTNAPGGLFAPALVMGSALGYLVGGFGSHWQSQITETTYALAGMGAFFTSVVRVPVTAIIIVFELTGNFNIVLPLMVACATSYLVAESLFPRSLYDHLLETKGIFLQEDHPDRDFLSDIRAAQVMKTEVESLNGNLTLAEVLPIMSSSHHRGFPVVEEGRLVGVFTQTDLANAAQESSQVVLRQVMTPNPITVNPDAPLSDVLYLLNRYQLSRLPVVQGGQKLVGIITRTDIIREEVSQLGSQLIHPPHPAYAVYQTRSPAVGEGRILLPVNHSDSALALFQMAAAIAKEKNYEIDCLQIIPVPKSQTPSEQRVASQTERKFLQRLERLARHQGVLLHTEIKLAHSVTDTILDAVQTRHADLLIVEWQGEMPTGSQIFGKITDKLIDQAPCPVLLIKPSNHSRSYPRHLSPAATWLMPVAGGPNIDQMLEFLPGLFSLYPEKNNPELLIAKVYMPQRPTPYDPYQDLKTMAQRLEDQLQRPIIPIPICSPSVANALSDLAQARDCAAIVLGASREGLLKNVLHGNIPTQIATQADATVFVFRGALDSKTAEKLI